MFKSLSFSRKKKTKPSTNDESLKKATTLFLRNMAHRIDTDMLKRISRSSDKLKNLETTTSIPDFVKQLFVAGEQYADCLENILSYYSAINGTFIPIESPIFIRNIVSDASFEAKEKIRFLVDVKPLVNIFIDSSVPVSELIGDGSAIMGCLKEIIYNGLRHDIDLKTNVSVFSRVDNPCDIVFQVTNTGVHLSESELQNIFEPFSSINSDYVMGSGIGIGLAKCKIIIERLGGSISASWDEISGTKFEMSITLKSEKEVILQSRPIDISYERSNRANTNSNLKDEASTFSSTPVSLESEQPRILVVDDSVIARKQFQKMLKLVGVDVDICVGPMEALEKICSDKYDMICLDIIMPIMSGITCAEKIREGDSLNKETPIAMITADNSMETRALCSIIRNSMLIPKPVRRNVLYRSVYGIVVDDKKREWMRREYYSNLD